MDNSELAKQVVENVRGDRAAIKRISEAILSENVPEVREALRDAKVEVGEEDVKKLIGDKKVAGAAALT
jgi:hypothetical protein